MISTNSLVQVHLIRLVWQDVSEHVRAKPAGRPECFDLRVMTAALAATLPIHPARFQAKRSGRDQAVSCEEDPPRSGRGHHGRLVLPRAASYFQDLLVPGTVKDQASSLRTLPRSLAYRPCSGRWRPASPEVPRNPEFRSLGGDWQGSGSCPGPPVVAHASGGQLGALSPARRSILGVQDLAVMQTSSSDPCIVPTRTTVL